MIPIVRAEYDGLPVFWAEVPRQFTGALVFRVGRGDETLATGGLSHLVEHLALPTDRRRSVDFNGSVDGVETTFFASGARESVLDFLAEAADALNRLPIERLDVERRILLTEAAGVGGDPVRMMSMLRFGTVGHGLVGYDEYGLRRVEAADVSAWATERFTRENAAVWLTGEPPELFRLNLPVGRRIPAVEPDPIPYLTFPCAYDRGPSGFVATSIVARRTTPLMAVIEVAQHRLIRALRYEEGLSYAVNWWFGPLTAAHGHSVLWADLLEENAERVRDRFLATLYELAEQGPTEEELDHDVHELRRFFENPDSLSGSLAADATRELIGMPPSSRDTYLEERAAVTPSAAADALREALASLFVAVPYGCGVGDLDVYPAESPAVVDGRRRRLQGLGNARTKLPALVVGETGISWLGEGEHRSTVRFDECSALLRWHDGTRALWGRDGFYVEVDPDDWSRGAAIVELIDERVPAELVVPMERELEERAAPSSRRSPSE